MPKLIEYPKADVFNSLVSLLDRNKPNVKYTLTAEYVKDGKKYEADCGQLLFTDPIINILYLLLSNNLYSSNTGVTNLSVQVLTNSTGGTNVNASTSWLSASYNLSGSGGYGSTNNFSIKFSTTIGSQVSGTAEVSQLNVNFYYGQNSSGQATGQAIQINTLGPTTGGVGCSVYVSAGSVVTWTLSGSVTQSNSNALASWYVMLWNEIWAEFIAATGVSGAPTGLWGYPPAGTALFNTYSIVLKDSGGTTIGAYNVSGTSNTAISNPTLSAGTSMGFSTAPSLSFTFTPTINDTLQTIIATIYVNGTRPSSPYTDFASTGGLVLSIQGINQSVTANTPYSITIQDNVQVSLNT